MGFNFSLASAGVDDPMAYQQIPMGCDYLFVVWVHRKREHFFLGVLLRNVAHVREEAGLHETDRLFLLQLFEHFTGLKRHK